MNLLHQTLRRSGGCSYYMPARRALLHEATASSLTAVEEQQQSVDIGSYIELDMLPSDSHVDECGGSNTADGESRSDVGSCSVAAPSYENVAAEAPEHCPESKRSSVRSRRRACNSSSR